MTTKTLEDIIANPIKTNDPALTIQMPNQKLKVGGHTFQLVVADNSGNISVPATVMLIVVDNQAPTAVLTVTNEVGSPLDGNRIPFGSNFTLNGKKSVDVGGGNIVSYTWTLVD